MALPPSTETPRLRYLQDIVDTATDGGWADWPTPKESDYTQFGKIIVLFSYIDVSMRRIVEAAGRSMNNFRNQPQRLKGARPEFLQQQKFSEVMQVTFVSDGEHCAQSFQVNILRPDLVMYRHAQVTKIRKSRR